MQEVSYCPRTPESGSHPHLANIREYLGLKETNSLQRVLAKHMPEQSVRGIVEPVFQAYKNVWGNAFEKANPKTKQGKERYDVCL